MNVGGRGAAVPLGDRDVVDRQDRHGVVVEDGAGLALRRSGRRWSGRQGDGERLVGLVERVAEDGDGDRLAGRARPALNVSVPAGGGVVAAAPVAVPSAVA